MKDIEQLKKFIEGRISHSTKRVDKIKELHRSTPNITHNYYEGQTLGYWQGKLSAYEILLDEIEGEE